MSRQELAGSALAGLTVLVTGAGSGIGGATARALADAGARTLVHARSERAADAAVGTIRRSAGGQAVLAPVWGDLGSLAGVGQLAAQARQHNAGGLHVLVNNAGAAFSARALSPDGVERTIAVNHLAVAALTEALLDDLRAGARLRGRPSRVVNVTSVAERRGHPDADWAYPAGYQQFQAYSDSKLLSLAYAYALARRVDPAEVTVNAANPGSVATGFGSKAGGFLKIIMAAGKPFMASPDKGARTSLRLATDPGLDGTTGGYYSSGKAGTSSAPSRDRSFQEQVMTRTGALLRAVSR